MNEKIKVMNRQVQEGVPIGDGVFPLEGPTRGREGRLGELRGEGVSGQRGGFSVQIFSFILFSHCFADS